MTMHILHVIKIQFRTILSSPFVTSGVRLGTPAVTTRGMKEDDMDKIAEIIAMVIESEENVETARKLAAELTEKYPLC